MGQCASELATERPKRRVAAPAIGSRRSRRRMQQQALMAAVAGLVANQQNAPPADPRQLDDEPAANAVTPMGVRSENDEGAEQAETPVGADESSNERRSETAGRMDEVDPHLADAVNPLAALPLHHQRPVTPTKAESTRSSSIGHLGVQEGPEDGNDGDAAALEARNVEDDDKSSSAADGEGRRRSTLAKDDVGGYDDDDAPGRASSSGSSRLAFCGRASSMNDSFDSESLPHFAELEPAATRLLHSSNEIVPYAPPRPSCRTAAMRDDTTTAATNVARTHSFKRQQEFLADAAVSSGLSSSVADRSSFLFDWLSSLDIGRSYATENDNSSTPISRPLTPRGGAAVAVVL